LSSTSRTKSEIEAKAKIITPITNSNSISNSKSNINIIINSSTPRNRNNNNFIPTPKSIKLEKYIETVASGNSVTAYDYERRLSYFAFFVDRKYNLSLDELVAKIRNDNDDSDDSSDDANSIDVYELLSSYVTYMQNRKEGNVPSPISLKYWVSTVRNFLEYWDIEISQRKLKLKVRMPRVIRQSKEALTKEDIVNILNACSDIKLKTYCMFLAATGCRASEALSIRLCDIEFDSSPAKAFIRGEYTKTRTDRYVLLTSELVDQLNKWLEFKYRRRRVWHLNKEGKSTTEIRSPDRTKRTNDLVFSTSITKQISEQSIEYIYSTLVTAFQKTLDRMGGIYASYEDVSINNTYSRHRLTLHSFRRWVKSVISDLGYSDFSEWFIGHAGSTYYRKSENERAELFRKVESYLTYLDYATFERKGADIQSKVDMLERENALLRQHDTTQEIKNKEIVALVSDQITELNKKVDRLEQENLKLRKESTT
jgi:integrase